MLLGDLLEDLANRLALLVDFAVVGCHVDVEDDVLDRLVLAFHLLSFNQPYKQVLRDILVYEGACEDRSAEVFDKFL